ncbi:hypothetical protein NQ318_003831 [Aromia moschata]|uniref:Major facilitator superfamily (MFS) profile domain-containing protein n=1 Tax=Aromia moschata TaxID=1265417 RepID=A0AAV8XK53_9CUCU|nr:hypothetical protein NQ318_003831 [Aromia moschata]
MDLLAAASGPTGAPAYVWVIRQGEYKHLLEGSNILTFSTGTSIAWPSPTEFKLQDADESPFDRALTSDETSWIFSLLPVGIICGPFIFGYLADKIGRKFTLIACGAPVAACYLLMAFCKIPAIFYVTRFVIGLSVAGGMAVLPMYVGEIAEDFNRGTLGSALNCFVGAGVLFSYSLAPESAHYYVQREEYDLAKQVLMKIRGGDSKRVETEIAEIQMKLQEKGRGTILDIFRSKGTRKAFIISVCLLAVQQLSGVIAVLSYAQNIFQQAGTSLEPAVCSIIVGGVQFGASFITPVVTDRLGRKPLLLISAIGMTTSEVSLGVYSFLKEQGSDVSSISWLPVLCLIIYIITYNMGFGSLPLAIMAELFPTNVKSIAFSTTTTIAGFISFAITQYFRTMLDAIGMGPSFWIFAGFCVISIPFCLLYVIETKGKSLQDIQKALNS